MSSTAPTKRHTLTQTKEAIPLRIEEVEENRLLPPQDKTQKKLHISKFLVTVNSNVAVRNVDQANRIADCLKRGIPRAIKEHATEVFFVKAPATDEINADTVKSIDVSASGEIGPKYKRIHSHALVTVKHYTLLQMNSKALKGLLLDYCKDDEIKNLYVDIKFVPVSDFAEMYIEKASMT